MVGTLSPLEKKGATCFLSLEIVGVDDKSENAKQPSGSNVISSDVDYRAGSSFELSPSDSSDGTYMWDEEGLEPIGSVHPCGSYDSSEMNSIVSTSFIVHGF
uniref:Serine-rich coiled-coil domain-containing protein 2 n=1 Tax=Sphaerodactylus townsendi TaxID=933632 RepID=A0ACB8F8D7_9SAUR